MVLITQREFSPTKADQGRREIFSSVLFLPQTDFFQPEKQNICILECSRLYLVFVTKQKCPEKFIK